MLLMIFTTPHNIVPEMTTAAENVYIYIAILGKAQQIISTLWTKIEKSVSIAKRFNVYLYGTRRLTMFLPSPVLVSTIGKHLMKSASED